MLAALLQSDSSLDLGPILDAVKDHAWVTVVVLGVALLVALASKLGLLAKLGVKDPAAPAAPVPAPAPVDPQPAADASKAQDLLDGKK